MGESTRLWDLATLYFGFSVGEERSHLQGAIVNPSRIGSEDVEGARESV